MAGLLRLLLLAAALLVMAPASQAQYVPAVRVPRRMRSIDSMPLSMGQLYSGCVVATFRKTFARLRMLYCLQIGLYGEVLNYQVTPTGTTAYGTPRTFSATVVNLGTG